MTTWVRADEAVRLLGVSKPTLYAYVSRGLVERHTAPDGRTSLYARDDIDTLAARGRGRTPSERPTIDAQITSAITTLHDAGLIYRGHRVDELARTSSFEQVAELLWTGELPDTPPAWPVDRDALRRITAAADAARVDDPLARLALAATVLAAAEPAPSGPVRADPAFDPPAAARRLLALAPSVLGGPAAGTVAGRLARAWHRRPSPELVTAVDRALVLLADHELATSTLAVRVAVSVRTDAYSALAVGLQTVGGALHGGASAHAAALFADAERRGAAAAVGDPLDRHLRLAGFGHSIYRSGDPRVDPLMEAVAALDARGSRMATVEAVRAEALRTLGRHTNVDFALGALLYVAELPTSAPLFAIARIAGWAAHAAEEAAERPLRYRGLARTPT